MQKGGSRQFPLALRRVSFNLSCNLILQHQWRSFKKYLIAKVCQVVRKTSLIELSYKPAVYYFTTNYFWNMYLQLDVLKIF